MSNLAANAALGVFKQEAQKRGKKEDPYFEEYQTTNWLGRPKTKKRKKTVPQNLSKNDQEVYKKVRKMAKTLDEGLCNCCGVRIGWSAVIGLMPGVGDLADVILALNLLRKCEKIDHGLPSSTRARMQLNIAIDFVVGLVPIAGDIADAFYKCNTRNLLLLEGVLRKRAAEAQARIQDIADSEEEDHAGAIQMNQPGDGHRYGRNRRGSTGGHTSRGTSGSRGNEQGPVREYSAIGHGGGSGNGNGNGRDERRYHNHHQQYDQGRPGNGGGFF